MKYADITQKIIGCAMTVHNTLGNGFQEVIYQRALAVEFAYQNILFKREKEMEIYYRGKRIGKRRVDFFVDNIIMVELKAIIKLEDVHLAQAMNYLEAFHIEIGLLINFGAKSLEFKRVHNNKLLKESFNQVNQGSRQWKSR
ncbi:GxxExxY protein [Desulfococcaceae bacterium HSG7]|nr:GxxExxY protein [Desulfococcaceae bacterium HSG7]